VVIDEFSFLNISKGDSKDEKALKFQCLKHIKTLVNVGRASGIFLITSLQKPTADSIPTDIKAQLCTRISFKIVDLPSSMAVLGNGNATNLKERQFICKTLDEQVGYSFTVSHEIIQQYLRDKIKRFKPMIINAKTVEPRLIDDNTPPKDNNIDSILELLKK